jgi:hypothetical protein
VASGVSVGLGVGISLGVAVAPGDPLGVGVGEAFFRFPFVAGVGLGDGVGEVFFRFGEAVGDEVGVDFPADRFRCFRAGVGVGVAVRNFLIFVPNDSSAARAPSIAPNKIARIKSHFINSHPCYSNAVVSAVLSDNPARDHDPEMR